MRLNGESRKSDHVSLKWLGIWKSEKCKSSTFNRKENTARDDISFLIANSNKNANDDIFLVANSHSSNSCSSSLSRSVCHML